MKRDIFEDPTVLDGQAKSQDDRFSIYFAYVFLT